MALFLSALAVPTTMTTQAEAANIDACGDINVEANAQCEVKVGVDCKAECEPVNFTASCYADCSGSECTVQASAMCTGSCEADCSGQCMANPGNFDCNASCTGQCEANCQGECSSSNDQATCQGSCEATCEGECSASCEGTPPSASCDAKCSASCEGECSAEANIDCQIDCQAGCTAELTGGCELECDKPEGALFCDGQYIDHGGNLEECIAALESLLEINVDVSAQGSASCEGGSCEAEGKVSAGCAMAPAPQQDSSAWWLLGAAGLALGVMRRRRDS
jgi:MYXO-CTERM domain-containing protein